MVDKLSKLLYDEMLHFADRIESILEDNHLDSDDMVYIKFFLNTMKPGDAMHHVIDKVLPWRTQIKNRNTQFFYKNKEIFGKLPDNKVNYFSDLWKNGALTKDDEDEIWEFFDVFVAYAEEYKKKL